MRADIHLQRGLFQSVLESTIAAARISSVNRFLVDEKHAESIGYSACVLEFCSYKVEFPRQIGKSSIVKDFIRDEDIFLIEHINDLNNLEILIKDYLYKRSWVFIVDSGLMSTPVLERTLGKIIQLFKEQNKEEPFSWVFPSIICIR